MTTSESINFSKYEIINEQNTNLSTNLDILKNNNKNKNKEPEELSQNLLSSNDNEKENENENENENEKNIENSNPEKEKSQNMGQTHNLLYGNPIDSLNPKFIGKSLALLYDFRGDPKITIGPDCKLINLQFI